VNRNKAALERMVAHHHMMVAQLGSRVARLPHAAEDGYLFPAIGAVQSYLDSEVFPDARAQEKVVYTAARAAGLSALVEEMVVEHRRLFAEAEKLSDIRAAGDAVDTARRIASLFAQHAEKENAFILAPLAGDPKVDLASLLQGMERMVAG
jgi:hypothetical protein